MSTSFPNFLIDGDMEQAGTTYWSSSGSIAKSSSNPHSGSQCLEVASGAYTYVNTGAGALRETPTVGHIMRIAGWARGDGSGNPVISGTTTGGAAVTLWTGTSSTDWQYFDVEYCIFEAKGFYLGAIGGYAYFDDLTYEVSKRNLLLDGWMEETDTSKWAPTYATLSKETTDPYHLYKHLRITDTNTSGGLAVQGSRHIVGHTYRFLGRARGDTNTYPRIIRWTDYATLWSGSTANTWQEINIVYKALHVNGIYLYNPPGVAGYYTEWDKIELYDITASKNWQRINGLWRL